jgi:hypothetical protein
MFVAQQGEHMRKTEDRSTDHVVCYSAASIWAPLRPFIAAEAQLAQVAGQNRWTAALYEFIRFGVKQAYACLFGGIAVALMLATWQFYPAHAAGALRLPLSLHARRSGSAARLTAGELGGG